MNHLPFLLAKNFYYSTQKNFSTTLMSILSKIGISISVFVLLISLSAVNGFQVQINKKILSSFPHGIIALKNPSEKIWKNIKYKIENIPEIFYAERYVLLDGLLEKNNILKLVQIKGFINIKNVKKNFSLKDIEDNNYQEKKNNIIISSDIANILCVKKNDFINIIVPDKKNYFLKLYSQYLPMQITSIFPSKGRLDSNVVSVPLHFIQQFFNTENTISEIELKISDPFNIDKIIMQAVKKVNTPVVFHTWIETYKYIYHDIQMIKAIVYLSISLVMIISCLSISSISFILISKKTKDIAILRSIGANNFFIQCIFFYYGLRFIIVGLFIGFFIGVLTILNFKTIMLFLEKTLNSNILINYLCIKDFVLLELNIVDIMIILITTIIIGVITNLYPAYYASTINPVQTFQKY